LKIFGMQPRQDFPRLNEEIRKPSWPKRYAGGSNKIRLKGRLEEVQIREVAILTNTNTVVNSSRDAQKR